MFYGRDEKNTRLAAFRLAVPGWLLACVRVWVNCQFSDGGWKSVSNSALMWLCEPLQERQRQQKKFAVCLFSLLLLNVDFFRAETQDCDTALGQTVCMSRLYFCLSLFYQTLMMQHEACSGFKFSLFWSQNSLRLWGFYFNTVCQMVQNPTSLDLWSYSFLILRLNVILLNYYDYYDLFPFYVACSI